MRMKTLVAIVLVLSTMAAFTSCGEEKPEDFAYISGTIYEKTTKAPIPDAIVTLGNQTMTSTTDGRFIFSKLEKGSKHVLECSKALYKDFKLENLVAVYPGTTQDIELEIEVPNPPKTVKLGNLTTKNLKSFDYVLSYGTSPTQITYEMSGSFSAPDSFSHTMRQYRQQQVQVGPDDAKKESPPIKLIEIAGKQWIDEGSGFSAVPPDQLRQGFRDMFSMIEDRTSIINKAFKNAKNIEDVGASTIGGIPCNRYRGLTIIQLQRPVESESGRKIVNDTVLCEFNIAVATQAGLENTPIDIDIMLFYKDLQSRPYSHITLSNCNSPIAIKVPEIKNPSIPIKVNP